MRVLILLILKAVIVKYLRWAAQPGRQRPGRSGLVAASLVLLGLFCSALAPVEAAAPELVADFNEISAATVAAPANSQFVYVDGSGHGITGPLLRFYTRTGGAERHGKPLSEPVKMGNHYLQYFERSALEFYPDYAGTGTEVRFARLGQSAAETGADVEPVTPFVGTESDWYFPESGHSLREPFLSFWRNEGGQDGLGLPISEELDGPVTIQYFENAALQRPQGSANAGEVTFVPLGETLAKEKLNPAQLAPVAKERFTAPRTVKIPSLMFHYAREVDPKKDLLGYNLSIKPDNYLKFLDWVQDNGYTTVTVGQVYDYLQYGILLPDKPVQFRWDDGHDSNWFVYQEMKKRGMTATFFVISQKLELTPDQWRQIDKDGFEIGAHTRTHPDLRGVSDLAGEITGSRTDLETMLGHPVRSFAYPSGKYNDRIVNVVRNSGFAVAVTTDGGYTWTGDLKLKEPVVSVTGQDNVESFGWKVKLGTATQAASANNATATKIPASQKTAPPTAKS
jgi:peptidoglycan/xylan/chitin deacetylase (PgdA/CDA1 family)